jgi:multidrug efflux pump subunit AcrA (membrane-fusion protein)
MNKKVITALSAIIVLLIAGLIYLAYNLSEQTQINRDMEELATLDKQEMEGEYRQFADQYSEMKTRINNDSIIAQLTREQERTEQLLQELKKTKATDAAEITRLKKELASVRAVLRSYVLEIDSLNRLNQALQDENSQMRTELEESNQQNQALTNDNASLSQKVAIAAQLNAVNIDIMMIVKAALSSKAKERTKHPHKIGGSTNEMKVRFVLSRNVTASNGMRKIYVRILTPTGSVLNVSGQCPFEDKEVAYTAVKAIEYTGEETPMELFVAKKETLIPGDYRVQVIADGHEIGARTIELEK